jgi:hypothetical protein
MTRNRFVFRGLSVVVAGIVVLVLVHSGGSTLSSAGLSVWPAFTSTGTPRAEGGANAAQIGTITETNGSRQVTYSGRPLYYYVRDQEPRSTSGQGLNQFGALRYVLSLSGNAITNGLSSRSPAAPQPGGGYGY